MQRYKGMYAKEKLNAWTGNREESRENHGLPQSQHFTS